MALEKNKTIQPGVDFGVRLEEIHISKETPKIGLNIVTNEIVDITFLKKRLKKTWCKIYVGGFLDKKDPINKADRIW